MVVKKLTKQLIVVCIRTLWIFWLSLLIHSYIHIYTVCSKGKVSKNHPKFTFYLKRIIVKILNIVYTTNCASVFFGNPCSQSINYLYIFFSTQAYEEPRDYLKWVKGHERVHLYRLATNHRAQTHTLNQLAGNAWTREGNYSEETAQYSAFLPSLNHGRNIQTSHIHGKDWNQTLNPGGVRPMC